MNIESTKKDPVRWILLASLLLSLFFIIVALLLVSRDSQADSVTTQVTVQNADPTVTSIRLSDSAYGTEGYAGAGGGFQIQPGDTKTYYITGTANDANGRSDIANVGVVFYVDSATSSCSADDNNCYIIASCDTQNGSTANDLDYSCQIDLEFWATSTTTGGPDDTDEWQILVTATDTADATGTLSQNRELDTTLALDIPSTIDFGTRALPTETTNANNVAYTLTQNGNDVADIQASMSASSFTCSTSGSFPRNRVKHAPTDVAWGDVSSTALTASPANVGINVGYRTNDGADLTADSYWNIKLETADAAAGTCSGTVTITAVAAS